MTAGARSPFSTSPTGPSRGALQDGTGTEGSPITGHAGTKNNLFAVKSSSITTQRDVRGFTKLSAVEESGKAQDASGYQAPGSVSPAIFAASSLALAQATPASAKRPKVSIRGLAISNPIVNDEADPDTPFAKIATIDLKTAVVNDQERRAISSKKSPFNAPRAVPLRPPYASEFSKKDSNNGALNGGQDQSNQWIAASGLSTSASISSSREEVRRRSPRGINNLEILEEKQTSRPIAGIPSNPTSQVFVVPQKNTAPPTVMLMNDIIYDNPEIVKSIQSTFEKPFGHSKQKSLQELSPLTPYTSGFEPRESMMHRPRPIPRSKKSGMFASEPLPGHRRTKSSSSILNRKTFLRSTLSGPSELPPLPTPPPIYTASKLKKLLLNDTKSMTFNEKIEFLFPAPPGESLRSNRRSSVPDLRSMATLTDTDPQSTPISKRTTTIAVIPTQSYPAQSQLTEADSNRETYTSNAVDSVSDTLVPSHNSTDTNIFKLGSERQPYVSRNEDVAESTFWEDYMSQISPSNASDVYIQSMYSELSPPRSQRFTPDVERLERMSETPFEDDEGEGDEVMVVMMNSAEIRNSIADSVANERESFVFDINGLPVEATHPVPSWHRRIGDELPAFSDRRSKHGSRRMIPPAALSLEPPRGRASPILIRNVEPSPPLDSPARALQEIRDQLNRFDEASRQSLESILRLMPNKEEAEALSSDDDLERLRLLEDLEKEMGEQENDWQQMHRNFSRDSMSSIGTLATPQSRDSPALTRPTVHTTSSHRLSLGLRRQRNRDSLMGTSAIDDKLPSQTQEDSSLGAWQQRLADAQISYMENAPTAFHSRNSSINFLSVTKVPLPAMGSPTPPDSEPEEDSRSEYESEEEEILKNEHCISSPRYAESMWQPAVEFAKTNASLLWNSNNEKPSPESNLSLEPPAKSLRPSQRQSESEMLLSSGELWTKSSPNAQSSNISVPAMWVSASAGEFTSKPRPVTQRPPRRSKRMTQLADIGM